MLIDFSKAKIFIKPGATDMRKQINGLSVIVNEELQKDPLSGSLFIFCNKNRRLMKILYWDRNGFCLWLKRLEKHKFPWPKTQKEAKEITGEHFKMLLDGINFWEAHQRLKYDEIN